MANRKTMRERVINRVVVRTVVVVNREAARAVTKGSIGTGTWKFRLLWASLDLWLRPARELSVRSLSFLILFFFFFLVQEQREGSAAEHCQMRASQRDVSFALVFSLQNASISSLSR